MILYSWVFRRVPCDTKRARQWAGIWSAVGLSSMVIWNRISKTVATRFTEHVQAVIKVIGEALHPDAHTSMPLDRRSMVHFDLHPHCPTFELHHHSVALHPH